MKAPKHEFRVQLCRSGVIIVKHSDSTSLHELLQYAPIRPALHRVSSSNETVPNAPKHYETHQNMSLGSNWVDRVGSLQNIRCDFVARPFALIAPVQPVLHRFSCSNETIQNAPKHYETHQNMSLGSNWVDRVRSSRTFQ